MKNSIEQVKLSLTVLLDDPDIRVFALRGKWGTGKTHLWDAIHAAREQAGKSTNSVKVSLFGIRSIQDLKLRLFQNIYFKEAPKANAANFVGGVLASLTKKYTGYSLEDSAKLMLPSLIKKKLIVLDDIERKHNAFDIAELLGFIDEFSLTYDARFLLLLNTHELAEKEIWLKLHEKIIDADLLLDPSPAESFAIASHGAAHQFIPELRRAIEVLEITNIRILKSIVRLCAKIARESGKLSDYSIPRWIPSSALLSAVHYMGVAGAPSLADIEDRGSLLFDTPWPNNNQLNLDKWNRLVNALGRIEFLAMERVVADYLQSGIMDAGKLIAELEIYKHDAQKDSLHARMTNFMDAFEWDTTSTREELIGKARLILGDAELLAPHVISDLVKRVRKLGDEKLAKELLDRWTTLLAENSPHLKTDSLAAGFVRNQYHPEVSAAIHEIRKIAPPSTTILEAIEGIGNENWGEREADALSNSTVQGYSETLRHLSGEKLRSFMIKHLRWARDSSTDHAFLTAEENFMSACRMIYHEEMDSRLAAIIERLFELNSFTLDEALDVKI